MLGKLFKHEMKACIRLLLPLYLVLVVLTPVDRLVLNLNVFHGVLRIIPGIITMAYVSAIIAIFIVSFVIIILRFYKNLITDEGYLMFTLPVKPHHLITSKLIASIIWTVSSVIAVLASIFALVITPEKFDILKKGFNQFANEFNNDIGEYKVLFLIEFVFIIVLAIIATILQIYASIAIGQLFNGHKVIGSFAAYIVLYVITQILGVIFLCLGELIFKNTVTDVGTLVKVIMPILLLFVIILDVAYYWIINFMFKKKLNPE